MAHIRAPYYTFRRVRNDWYEVSKWNYYSMTPENTYTVLLWRKTCNCNSPYRPCKHYNMVQSIAQIQNLHEWAIDSNGQPWENVDL